MSKFHERHGQFALAVVSSVLVAVTPCAPQWIEAAVGVNLDRNSGALEWAVTAVSMLAALVAALSARRYYRRLLAKRDRQGS
jgi:hypothetical protein